MHAIFHSKWLKCHLLSVHYDPCRVNCHAVNVHQKSAKDGQITILCLHIMLFSAPLAIGPAQKGTDRHKNRRLRFISFFLIFTTNDLFIILALYCVRPFGRTTCKRGRTTHFSASRRGDTSPTFKFSLFGGVSGEAAFGIFGSYWQKCE